MTRKRESDDLDQLEETAAHPLKWGERIALGVLGFVTEVLDRGGMAAVAFVMIYVFVDRHATEDQKHEIIDKYILGQGITDAYAVALVGVVALLIIIAQGHVYRQKVRELQGEVERLSAWKSAYQDKNLPVDLHHTEVTKSPRG